MKKILLIAVASLFVSTAVFADTPTNMAVGYDAVLNGISARMITSSGIGVQGIVGLNFETPKASGAGSGMDLNLGANVFKCMWKADKVNLNCFAGVVIMMKKPEIKDADTKTNFAVMVGGEPEIFLLSNLSVSTKFGVQIQINGDNLDGAGKTVKDSGSTVFGTFGDKVSIVEGVSFNWYF
ncbi:MAG: hypothetical protein Q8O92_03830 [Candidatus Latescibacter sp.]|nr:hypothetical protein [Candidatus Latescibacter sp.]